MKSYKIAVIPGDGIGKEVVPEGIRVLDAAAGKFGLAFDWQHFDWSCQLYTQTGRMMPEDGLEQIAITRRFSLAPSVSPACRTMSRFGDC